MTDASSIASPSFPEIIALASDIFFTMRLRAVVPQLGYRLVTVTSVEHLLERDLSEVALVLVDFNAPVAWEQLSELLAGPVPVLAFSSHTNVEGFREAKAAGVSRVVSNGEMSRALPELVEKYARR